MGPDRGGEPGPAAEGGRCPRGRLSALLPRLLLLGVFAVVVGLLVDDPVVGVALVVAVQVVTLLPEIVRHRRRR